MTATIQVLTILAMILLTYVGLLAFGPPRRNLLYTRQEKAEWDELISRPLGNWLTATNIIGTLTSFATVFLFFLGNASIFGWVLFVCTITIWASALATNYFTSRICSLPRVSGLLKSPDQTGGVIASVFWASDTSGRQVARLVKWLSLANIAGVLWLEFALLSDVGGHLLGLDSVGWRSILAFALALAVLYFVLRFGIRGFVFTDIFQTPIIAFGSLLLLGGAAFAIFNRRDAIDFSAVISPTVGIGTLVLFAVHVVVLNLSFVLVNEPHWLRVWIFREKETRLQAKSTLVTAIFWALLIVVGFGARAITPDAVGADVISGLVDAVGQVWPGLIAAFWLAGIGALFTTADANVYSFLIVSGFRSEDGNIRSDLLARMKPFLVAAASAGLFAAVYAATRYLEAPFEKIIFLIMPLGLNLLPGMVQLIHKGRATVLPLITSLFGYSLCGLIGFLQPRLELAWTLAAALVPPLVGFVLWVKYYSAGLRPILPEVRDGL